MDYPNQGDQGGTGGGAPADTNVPAGGTYTPPASDVPAEAPDETPTPTAPLGDQPTSEPGADGGEQGGSTPTGAV